MTKKPGTPTGPLTAKDIKKEIAEKIGRGEFDAALHQADAAAHDSQGRDPYWDWQFRIMGARAQIFRGQFQDAIDRLKPPLPPEFATGDMAVLRSMNLANAEDYAQQFAAAEADIADAERLSVGAPPKVLMQVMQVRGDLEISQKRYARAEKAFRGALKIAQDLDLKTSEPQLLGSLGYVSWSLEHYDEATDRYQAALELTKTTGENSSLSTTLGNIASNYEALGDHQAALDYYHQAERAARRASQKAEQNEWLSSLAYVYAEITDFARAENSADEALTLANELQDPLSKVQSLNALTEIAIRTGQLRLAEQHNQKALAMETQGFNHDEVVSSKLDAGHIAELNGRLQEAERQFQEIGRDPNARTAARWESQARLAVVYAKEKRVSDAEREFQRCLQTVNEARQKVQREESRLSFLSGAMPFYGEYIDFLISQGRKLEALQIAEGGRARTLSEGLGSAPQSAALVFRGLGVQDLSRKLNSTLLCYWLGGDHSHLWVITPAKVGYFALPGSVEIDRTAKNYREALLASRDLLHPLNSDGTKLYSMLVEPAKEMIAKDARVTVLPDASLYGLNFETLIVPGAEPHYWVEDVSLTTASSLTLLKTSLARRKSSVKKLLLVGNTNEVNREFPKLDHASAEMQGIARYFAPGEREVLEGKDATPSAYLSSHPEKFGYLHFVTHGTASLTKPLESAVILSQDANGYKLYARDIVTHRLNASLVTISACNGAGSQSYSGEGLVGLSWAFLRAGAHNVIAALWDVNDRSTPQLMNALYDGLSKGQEPAAALREAKLSFLRSGTVYAKPYYWAPFQLYAGS
jgi:CHAT domain-containing protein